MPGGDSVKLIRDDNYIKRIHSEVYGSGRLQRGGSTRFRNASIPSKFQTFVMPNSDHRGFNSQSKRFQYYPSEVPGPGAYVSQAGGALAKEKTSHSKTGFGAMASKATRFPQKFTLELSPGPNVYETSPSPRKDFNRSVSSHQFHLPVTVGPKSHPLINREALKMPAPNQYDVIQASDSNRQASGAVTQFKSGTLRSQQNDKANFPGPSDYHVKDGLMQSQIDTNGAVNCFHSTSERLRIYDKQYKSPGPAAYNVTIMPEKSTAGFQFPKKHFLCLSAPAIPPSKSGPTPGPGHYNLGDNSDGRFPMSSAAFVSNSSRWQIRPIEEEEMPSPAQYNPQKLTKQSFMFNGRNNWVC